MQMRMARLAPRSGPSREHFVPQQKCSDSSPLADLEGHSETIWLVGFDIPMWRWSGSSVSPARNSACPFELALKLPLQSLLITNNHEVKITASSICSPTCVKNFAVRTSSAHSLPTQPMLPAYRHAYAAYGVGERRHNNIEAGTCLESKIF